MPARKLAPEELCRRCDPAGLGFATTADLEPLEPPLGQERAAEAIRFGVGIRREGFNVFVLGPPGAGKQGLVTRLVRERAAREKPPDDWCYLFRFSDRQRPAALRLPAGRAVAFRADMEKLVEELRAAIPALFESEDYRVRLQALEKQLEEKREGAMRGVQERARERGIALVRTPMGLALAPLRNGEVLDPDEFHKLPEEDQHRIQGDIAQLQEQLQAVLRSLPQLEREHRERVREMNREVALFAVGHLIDEVKKRYEDLPEIRAHLEAVQQDVVDNVHDFLGSAEAEDAAGQIRKLLSETPAMHRYRVNVLVDHSETRGAPVVQEDLPTHANLVGRIEHHAHFGTLVTDFTMVRGGALHRANGGYLVLDARRLLTQPFAWEDLKRALRSREIRIEPPERLLGLSGAAALEPQPIPLEVKVILMGERWVYHLLLAADPEFQEHFKVAADFEDAIDREGGERDFLRMVAALVRDETLRPFDREAAARVVEHAARMADDGQKLSSHLQRLGDLLREADHVAGEAGRTVVGRADVQAAVDAQVRRADRIQRRLLEEIGRGTLLIDTAGSRVGQVNGLAVYASGPIPFGHPSRITARVRMGRGEVVDIEREVELGGPIHSKGVLILSGFLGARFSADRPFTLSASLVFEQSYGAVEGDSASSAELYALLSALADLPVRQSVAVTGSVNQLGQVQAIGAVNEKVEGFFDVCRARGLTGEQGVIVPSSNVKHLMLREEVVEAARSGRFHVWAVDAVDEGIELLTGVPAGERGPDGRFPEGTVNARVAARIADLAEKARAYAEVRRGEEKP
jgi:lon-related putative ATP-dependent protease